MEKAEQMLDISGIYRSNCSHRQLNEKFNGLSTARGKSFFPIAGALNVRLPLLCRR